MFLCFPCRCTIPIVVLFKRLEIILDPPACALTRAMLTLKSRAMSFGVTLAAPFFSDTAEEVVWL